MKLGGLDEIPCNIIDLFLRIVVKVLFELFPGLERRFFGVYRIQFFSRVRVTFFTELFHYTTFC